MSSLVETYICKRCGYKSQYKQNLIAHLKRKRTCNVLFEDISIDDLLNVFEKKHDGEMFKCRYCDKQYTCRSNRSRHESTCSKQVNPVANLEQVVERLQEKVEQLSMKANIIQNGNISNIQNNNNITINLKSFGFENISHIENDKEFMTQCLINKDVMGLLQNIHCDKEHPENHNIKIKSTKKELMETYADGQWIISDQEETLDELLNKGYRIMNFFSYRNKNHIVNECEDGEDEYHEMREWLEDLYSNTKMRKPLKRKLLILFMNNKALFLEKGIDEEKTQPEIRNHECDAESDYDEMPAEEAAKYIMSSLPSRYRDKLNQTEIS